MIALDISTACGYNFRKEHYLVLLEPLIGGLIPPTTELSKNTYLYPIEPLIGGLIHERVTTLIEFFFPLLNPL